MLNFNDKKRIDKSKYDINRRNAAKPNNLPNHFYITRKTNIILQRKNAEKVLNESFDEIFIHGMGSSMNKALVIALEIERNLNGSVKSDIQTSTVQVTDEIFSFCDDFEVGTRQRSVSSIHIHIYRCA